MISPFLSALKGQNHTAHIPIWLMRQAGRYIPEYHALKKGQDLYTVFHDAHSIVAITELPLKKFSLDAAILFSDILMVLDSLSQEYTYQDQIGPLVAPIKPIVKKPAATAYPFLVEAIGTLKKTLKVPLIGFAGGPFTVACYLIEGKNGRDFKQTKKMLYQDPVRFSSIIDAITEATIDYLDLQVRAGVDSIQIFDSWAGILDYPAFQCYCLAPLSTICARFPSIVFCRGSSLFANELASLKPAAISLDWCGDLKTIRRQLPHVPLQGNLDPMLLFASKETIAKAVDSILDTMGRDPGYIFNLGHGILPDTPFENVRFLVDYVQDRSTHIRKIQ